MRLSEEAVMEVALPEARGRWSCQGWYSFVTMGRDWCATVFLFGHISTCMHALRQTYTCALVFGGARALRKQPHIGIPFLWQACQICSRDVLLATTRTHAAWVMRTGTCKNCSLLLLVTMR